MSIISMPFQCVYNWKVRWILLLIRRNSKENPQNRLILHWLDLGKKSRLMRFSKLTNYESILLNFPSCEEEVGGTKAFQNIFFGTRLVQWTPWLWQVLIYMVCPNLNLVSLFPYWVVVVYWIINQFDEYFGDVLQYALAFWLVKGPFSMSLSSSTSKLKIL